MKLPSPSVSIKPKSRDAIMAPSTAMPTMVWDTAKKSTGAADFATACTPASAENIPGPSSAVRYATPPTPNAAKVDSVMIDLNVAIASSVLLESIREGSFVCPSWLSGSPNSMKKISKFMHSWYPASDSIPSIMALRCMFMNPAIRVRVIANSGPVNPSSFPHSSRFGTFNLGSIPLPRRAETIHPVLNNVATAVAAAAPAHPVLNGHAQSAASPKTFSTAAHPTIFNGVTASLATMNRLSSTAWTMAAHDAAPLHLTYEAALVRRAGSTFSASSARGAEDAYSTDMTTPQIAATDRAGDAASFILSLASSSDDDDSFASSPPSPLYARDARPVAALPRKLNRYRAWSMQSVAGDSAASPVAPTVRPTKELSMLDNRGFVR
mmetsp:Transcript_21113/g.50960  ORF Transcript_21113/g.50960 Transcript_21113/m.50960 type:complete len:381 (+) Transcript_21113:107-1249(+)